MAGKAVALLIRVAVVGVFLAVGGLLTPGFVDAQSPSATRSFSVASVSAGGELDVTLTPRGFGRLGQVVETLPDGFRLRVQHPARGFCRGAECGAVVFG